MTTRTKNPAKVKAGRARAAQFTPESQRAAGAHQPTAARQAAGRKGAQATIAKHGYPALERKIGQNYLTVLERRVVAVFTRWGWQREIDYWIDYRVDLPTVDLAYFLDFVLPGKRYVEVNGAWVHAQAGKRAHQADKTDVLAGLGWRGLWLEEEETADIEDLDNRISQWIVENPPHHRQHAEAWINDEIPF